MYEEEDDDEGEDEGDEDGEDREEGDGEEDEEGEVEEEEEDEEREEEEEGEMRGKRGALHGPTLSAEPDMITLSSLNSTTARAKHAPAAQSNFSSSHSHSPPHSPSAEQYLRTSSSRQYSQPPYHQSLTSPSDFNSENESVLEYSEIRLSSTSISPSSTARTPPHSLSLPLSPPLSNHHKSPSRPSYSSNIDHYSAPSSSTPSRTSPVRTSNSKHTPAHYTQRNNHPSILQQTPPHTIPNTGNSPTSSSWLDAIRSIRQSISDSGPKGRNQFDMDCTSDFISPIADYISRSSVGNSMGSLRGILRIGGTERLLGNRQLGNGYYLEKESDRRRGRGRGRDGEEMFSGDSNIYCDLPSDKNKNNRQHSNNSDSNNLYHKNNYNYHENTKDRHSNYCGSIIKNKYDCNLPSNSLLNKKNTLFQNLSWFDENSLNTKMDQFSFISPQNEILVMNENGLAMFCGIVKNKN